MQRQAVNLRDGSCAFLFQSVDGHWACPVCGNFGLINPPYLNDGGASFEMCQCGFEFGYDDDPGASKLAVSEVQANWAAWRDRLLARTSGGERAQLVRNLQLIGIQVKA